MVKRIPVVAMFDHSYPSRRKNDREISLLCTRSGYKIIKAALDKLELMEVVRFDKWREVNGSNKTL